MKILKKLLLLVGMLPIFNALAMENILSLKEQREIYAWLLATHKITGDFEIKNIEESPLSELLPKKILVVFSKNQETEHRLNIIDCLNKLPVYTVSVVSPEDPNPRACCAIDITSLETILQKQTLACLNPINKE